MIKIYSRWVFAVVLVVFAASLAAQGPAMTVKELNAVRPDSLAGLVSFLLAVPTSHEAAIMYALMGALPFGMFASWWMKYSMVRSIDDKIVDYFFRAHSRRTMGTLGAYVAVCLTAVTTGVFDNNGVFAGWYTVLWMGVTNAFATDMGVNKGTQGQWTPEQRAEARAAQTDRDDTEEARDHVVTDEARDHVK